MTRLVAVLLAVALLAPLASVRAQDELTVGFVYIGPVTDGGWTQAHEYGRQHVEDMDGVRTIAQENVPENQADAERVMGNMIADGAKLIFATTYGYLPAVLNLATQHPDVRFVHVSGYVPDLDPNGNVMTLFGWQDEARYVAGQVAGGMSKSGKIGMVAAFPIPEVVRAINAFTLGARTTNPEATVRVVWTNTWFDPQKEAAAAAAVLETGVDVIAQYQDSPATAQAAEQRGVYAIGNDLDMSKGKSGDFDGDPYFDLDGVVGNQLTAPVWDWRGAYESIVAQVIDGGFRGENRIDGWADGITGLAPLHADVPDDLRATVEAEEARFRSGEKSEYTIFAGPLRDQDGGERVPSGGALSDVDLLSIQWFVAGVDGEIPD
jgi:basic membrane protein A